MKREIESTTWLKDYVFIKVNSELNDVAGYIKDENGNEIELKLNPNFNPTHHSRICAEVISAPDELTAKDSTMYEVYPGSPRPALHRDHFKIKQYKESLPPKSRNDPRLQMPYLCGGYAPEYITLKGVTPEVQKGDVVYFHFNMLLDLDNYWCRDGDSLIYRINYKSLFCYVRDGTIHMINDWVLVSSVSDIEELEIDGHKVRGKMHGNLVLVDLDVKSKNKQRVGILEHIGTATGPDMRNEVAGTRIVFRPGSEFVNSIEGREYYTMSHRDLIGKIVDGELQAIGDYVKVVPDQQKVSNNKIHVFDPNAVTQEFKPGEIFVLKTSISQKRKISKTGTGTIGDVKILYEKSSYYHFIEEFGVVLIRKGDILGTFKNI